MTEIHRPAREFAPEELERCAKDAYRWFFHVRNRYAAYASCLTPMPSPMCRCGDFHFFYL